MTPEDGEQRCVNVTLTDRTLHNRYTPKVLRNNVILSSTPEKSEIGRGRMFGDIFVSMSFSSVYVLKHTLYPNTVTMFPCQTLHV